MSYAKKLYLVRHGDYKSDGSLNEAGRNTHAPSALKELLGYGLSESSVILSSIAARAEETAEIIAKGLGAQVVLSQMIYKAGNDWHAPKLDIVIEQALSNAGVTIDADQQDLIVVTHAPMLAKARGIKDAEDIRYGEVFCYERAQ